MEPWVIPLLSLLGGAAGAYVGMRTAVAKLEVQVANVMMRVDELGRRSHKHHDRIGKLAARVWRLEEKSGLDPWKDDE